MVKNWIKIVEVILDHLDEELNIAKIAHYAKIDYKNVYNIIVNLEKMKIIDVKLFGKSKKIVLNRIPHPIIFETEYYRREKIFEKNKDFLIIYNKLSELNFPFIVLLFGSHVKGKAKKTSDIDLLIVCEKQRNAEIEDVLDLFPLKIHPTFVSFEEFMQMLKTTEFNVVTEAVKKNIILIGIEDYYRLLKNAE